MYARVYRINASCRAVFDVVLCKPCGVLNIQFLISLILTLPTSCTVVTANC